MHVRSVRNLISILVLLTVTLTTAYAENQLLNINFATADQLARHIKGVGPKKAEAIIQYRKKYGPFKSIEELINVKGIGPVTLNKNRHRITIASEDCRGCETEQGR